MKNKFCIQCANQIEQKNIDGVNRLVCGQCGWILYDNPLPVASAICCNQNNELLVIQRGIEPNKGKWSIPGGFMEQGETPEEGCLRELYEETGIAGEIISNVGTGYCDSKMYGGIIFLYYAVKATTKDIVISDEVMQAKFMKYEEVDIIYSDTHKQFIKQFYLTLKDAK
jgi:ADP-ribose pyrophosphatase YjhB (NUDIX family)